jgi:hypothetical protein
MNDAPAFNPPTKTYLRRGEVINWIQATGLSGRYTFDQWREAGLLTPIVPGNPAAVMGNGPGQRNAHYLRSQVARLLCSGED